MRTGSAFAVVKNQVIPLLSGWASVSWEQADKDPFSVDFPYKNDRNEKNFKIAEFISLWEDSYHPDHLG